MGKKGDKWAGYGGYSYDARPWAPRPKAKNKYATEAEFPSYDKDWKQKDIEPVAEYATSSTQPRPSTFTKKVQATVNYARKQDVRVAKLTEDQALKERRWKAYTVKMQQAFMQEHAKHRSNLATLRRELGEATEAQQAAQQQLKDVLAEALRGDTERGQSSLMWEAMVGGQQAMDAEDDLQEEEAMLYAQRFMDATRRKADGETILPHFGMDGPAPSTPPHRSSGDLSFTPPAAYAPSGRSVRQSDPYMVSPTTAAMAAARIGQHRVEERTTHAEDVDAEDTAPDKADGPHRSPGPKQRSPVKAIPKLATVPLAGPGLAGKLEAKRAMQPSGGFHPGLRPSAEGHVPTFNISDDSAEASALPGAESTSGTASPGFGNLE